MAQRGEPNVGQWSRPMDSPPCRVVSGLFFGNLVGEQSPQSLRIQATKSELQSPSC